MEQEDIKKRFITCLILILLISGIFSIKSFWDNRKGVYYSQKLQDILEIIEKNPYSKESQSLLTERMEIQKILSRHYGFPKLFFFFFVILNALLAIRGLKTVSQMPHDTSISRRNSLRLIMVLVVFAIVILCFFLLEYHTVVRFGWVFILLLFQLTLLGFAFAFGISEEVYDTVMGNKKDKDLIEGPPPPAW